MTRICAGRRRRMVARPARPRPGPAAVGGTPPAGPLAAYGRTRPERRSVFRIPVSLAAALRLSLYSRESHTDPDCPCVRARLFPRSSSPPWSPRRARAGPARPFPTTAPAPPPSPIPPPRTAAAAAAAAAAELAAGLAAGRRRRPEGGRGGICGGTSGWHGRWRRGGTSWRRGRRCGGACAVRRGGWRRRGGSGRGGCRAGRPGRRWWCWRRRCRRWGGRSRCGVAVSPSNPHFPSPSLSPSPSPPCPLARSLARSGTPTS
jgi:hypothetical protein